jgi:hypothetical protein
MYQNLNTFVNQIPQQTQIIPEQKINPEQQPKFLSLLTDVLTDKEKDPFLLLNWWNAANSLVMGCIRTPEQQEKFKANLETALKNVKWDTLMEPLGRTIQNMDWQEIFSPITETIKNVDWNATVVNPIFNAIGKNWTIAGIFLKSIPVVLLLILIFVIILFFLFRKLLKKL